MLTKVTRISNSWVMNKYHFVNGIEMKSKKLPTSSLLNSISVLSFVHHDRVRLHNFPPINSAREQQSKSHGGGDLRTFLYNADQMIHLPFHLVILWSKWRCYKLQTGTNNGLSSIKLKAHLCPRFGAVVKLILRRMIIFVFRKADKHCKILSIYFMIHFN